MQLPERKNVAPHQQGLEGTVNEGRLGVARVGHPGVRSCGRTGRDSPLRARASALLAELRTRRALDLPPSQLCILGFYFRKTPGSSSRGLHCLPVSTILLPEEPRSCLSLGLLLTLPAPPLPPVGGSSPAQKQPGSGRAPYPYPWRGPQGPPPHRRAAESPT